MSQLEDLIETVAEGKALSLDEARLVFAALMSGKAGETQIGALLTGLRLRGETQDEIRGAVDVMRAHMTPVRAPDGAVDIVGTGGDQSGTYNISTCASLVVAGLGVPVAKHGSRAVSSKSGSSDVLQALGVTMLAHADDVATCLQETGICFMFAPHHHSAMRHVAPSRAALKFRTIFNLLGPLANPAGVRCHLIGVFSPRWLEPFAQVLKSLGSQRALIVHGGDTPDGVGGLDELTLSGHSQVAWLDGDEIRLGEMHPRDVGLDVAPRADLAGGDARENAAALRAVLNGKGGPYRDIVLYNAAAACWAAGRSDSPRDAMESCARSIDSGAARDRLDRLIARTAELSAARHVRP